MSLLRIILTFFLGSWCCFISTYGQKTKKVLIIGIDGCRSDALIQAHTPTLDSLISIGFFSSSSWHLGKTKSGPGWSSMLTGVWDAQHRVHNNRFSGHQFKTHPFFPSYLKAIDSSVQSAIIISWKSLERIAPKYGWEYSFGASNDEECLQKTIRCLSNQDPSITMVHFNDVDHTGHLTGFELNNPKYIQAIEGVDEKIKRLIQYLHSRPNFSNEDWLILSSTDHGGTGHGHSNSSDNERKIWWLGVNPSLPKGQVVSEDPGSYFYPALPFNPAISSGPYIVDIAATALDFLMPINREIPRTLQGKSWLIKPLTNAKN